MALHVSRVDGSDHSETIDTDILEVVAVLNVCLDQSRSSDT